MLNLRNIKEKINSYIRIGENLEKNRHQVRNHHRDSIIVAHLRENHAKKLQTG